MSVIGPLRRVALALALLVGPLPALAQATYPSGPVRLVVPYPAGGPASIVAHAIGEKLSETLGQPVIVDNRSGAGGNLGTEIVAKAPPDGQTLLLGTNGPLVVNVSLYGSLPFDPLKDFAPICYVASIPLVLIAHPSVPAKNVQEIVALAKAKPGDLSYASSGNGSGGHLAGALLSSMAGVEMVHVPYRGAAPATTDLIGGHVPLMFDGLAAALPYIKSGKVKALGVGTPRRAAGAPDIPTIAEQGLPGYEIDSWYGVLAPAGTPRPIVDRLNREIVRILDLPDVKETLFVKSGLERVASTPDEFASIIAREIPQYEEIVRISGAKAE
jgi:tripartite-type tricarboxylate transporter receptor subunit TctC